MSGLRAARVDRSPRQPGLRVSQEATDSYHLGPATSPQELDIAEVVAGVRTCAVHRPEAQRNDAYYQRSQSAQCLQLSPKASGHPSGAHRSWDDDACHQMMPTRSSV
jgi:hypothetical protein